MPSDQSKTKESNGASWHQRNDQRLQKTSQNYNTFQIECDKGLFLNVNLKTRFLRGKIAKVHKSKKNIFKKKILSDLASKLLILFFILFC